MLTTTSSDVFTRAIFSALDARNASTWSLERHHKTTLVYEYPMAEGDPYYPIPRPENAEIYRKYQQLASTLPNVYFTGRLGTYKYYNMDQVVAQSLTLYKKLMEQEPEKHVNGKKYVLLQA